MPQPHEARFSRHATQRMEEMGLTEAEIRRTIHHYEKHYEQTRQKRGRWCYQRGTIGVIVDLSREHDPVVVTVVWRDPIMWDLRKKVGFAR